MTNSRPAVCLLSCLVSVNDSHTIHFARVLLREKISVMTIRPGAVGNELVGLGLVHHELPAVTFHFWPEGTPVFEICAALGQRLRNCWQAIKLLWRHRPSVVMTMEPDSLLIALLLKPLLRHKVLADLRELYQDRMLAFPVWTQPGLRWLFRRIMWLLSCGTDEILHVSQERQAEYEFLAKPGVVVVYYPDAQLFARSGVDRPPLPTGWVALHAGPLRNSYAANQLLAAVEMARTQVESIRLVVLGGQLQKLDRDDLLKKLIANGTVTLVGNVPPSEVVRYLSAAEVGINLVLPVDRTHILAQPRKLYEYLLAGLPVIGADVPTIRRVIEESQCGLVVDPASPTAIAAALVRLATTPELQRELGRNASEAARGRYNWATQEFRFLGVVRSLMA